jgi:hypothetical protein
MMGPGDDSEVRDDEDEGSQGQRGKAISCFEKSTGAAHESEASSMR